MGVYELLTADQVKEKVVGLLRKIQVEFKIAEENNSLVNLLKSKKHTSVRATMSKLLTRLEKLGEDISEFQTSYDNLIDYAEETTYGADAERIAAEIKRKDIQDLRLLETTTARSYHWKKNGRVKQWQSIILKNQ